MTVVETNWLKSPGPHKLSGKQWGGIFAASIIFVGLWLAALSTYSDQPKGLTAAPIAGSEGLQITTRASTFNSTTEDLGVLLYLRAIGGLTDSRGLLLDNISIRIVDDENTQVIRLVKGDPISSKSISLQLEGDISAYPFDKYSGQFAIDVQKVAANGVSQPLEISVGTKRAETGWYTPFEISKIASNEARVSISSMHRERFHIMFAIMMTLLLLLLATISVVVGFLCITNRRASEPSLISWLGGIMIAMTLTRRLMPGDPPLGCALDVQLFSWALIFGISAIALAMVSWIRQSRAKLLED
ncbi:MAG: DUF4436 domain-containing protein [Actinobacteria bacterium]|nr:DUF4436 domain-containing protein [Actinomycetota bacterium]NBY15509.1 DUF4436 domain-containing protein [Actinomycetota bacterium]